MKPNAILVVTSLLSILLLSLHIAEDIVLGFHPEPLRQYTNFAIK